MVAAMMMASIVTIVLFVIGILFFSVIWAYNILFIFSH